MIQDLQLVNETVVPIHPLVADPSYPKYLKTVNGSPSWTQRMPSLPSPCTKTPNTFLFLSGKIRLQGKDNSICGQ
jgi:hypothetical protein